MLPLNLSRFWHRRVCEAAFVLSLSVIALHVTPYLTTIARTGLFEVSLYAAIAAAATALASLVFYIFAPKKPTYVPALVVYLLFTAMSGLLIFQSGDMFSPFIALWMLVSLFAGLFAVWGALAVLLASGAFVGYQYLTNDFSLMSVVMVGFSSIVPLIIGLIIWRNRDSIDESTKDVKNLASELSEVAQKSEIIINAIGDGVMAIDSQGVIQLINPAAQEILGWGKQDALMLNYKSVLKLIDAENHELDPSKDPISQVLNNNQEVRSNDLTVTSKSGKKMQISLVVSPIGETGSGVISVFRDITKEKAEGREQAEFVSTASHEMRTPVASIEGYLGLALNPNTAQIDDKARDFITKAHESAQHLGRLFQDLLDVSKTEDGRLSNNPHVIDVTLFAHDVVEGLKPKAKEKGLILNYVPIPDNSPTKKIAPVYFANIDNDHIREVLNNLVDNAIKYTPKGEVTVDVTGSDDKIVVSVKDTGLGIPKEDASHLFQKFYRVNNADRQEIGGTGLGLYLCRRLVEVMGGRIWVESVHGQGSTFFVELPRISSEQADTLKIQQAQQLAVAPVEAPVAPVVPDAPATPQPTAPTQPATANPAAPVATTVPRGELLTREQKAERVAQLEALARGQNGVPERPAQRIDVQSPPAQG